MRPLLLACLICVAIVSPASAQARDAPRRPRLPSTADTNSAQSYADYALDQLRRNPAQAAAALYWATRLEPANADLVYARHVALLVSDTDLLVGWMNGDRRVLASARALTVDTLWERAIVIDPFLRRQLDGLLLERYVENAVMRSQGARWEGDLLTAIHAYLNDIDDPFIRSWVLSSRGDYTEALGVYGQMVLRDSAKVGLRVERATAYVAAGRLDSARMDLEAALASARRADTTSIGHVYHSKAPLEYTLGMLLARMGDVSGARAALQRALVENLGYVPAYVRLSQLALAVRDSAAAVRELERAVDIRPDDYHARLKLGFLLGAMGRNDAAIPHLERAATVEPWAPEPVDLLAQVHDAAGHRAAALGAYQRFLALCRRDDPARRIAEQRIAALRNLEGASP